MEKLFYLQLKSLTYFVCCLTIFARNYYLSVAAILYNNLNYCESLPSHIKGNSVTSKTNLSYYNSNNPDATDSLYYLTDMHWSNSFEDFIPIYSDYNNSYSVSEKIRSVAFLNTMACRYPSFIWASLISNSVENIVFVHKKNLDVFVSLLSSDFENPLHSLIDICVVDNIARTDRFLVSYSFYNLNTLTYLTIRLAASNYSPIYSISKIHSAAGWLEREIWDMYGITFINHFDLRRILTDYGFTGHPLRKDFPLTGFFELRYNDIARRVDMEPLNLKQEMRFFFFNTNAWNYY